MAVELASGYVSIVPSTKGFGSALNKQIGPEVDKAARDAGTRAGDGFTSSFGGSLGKLAAIAATAVAGLQVAGFVKTSIDAASDLNETLSKVGVVLGQDVLPQVEAFAENAASALGQSKQSALDAAATFGVFGKSAGLTGSALGNFSTQMVGLASDLASFSNTSPEDAILAITAALRGESEPIRQYGVLLDEATLQQRAMKLGIISTTKQALTPQQRVLAAQAEILAQTTDAQGDFARTSGGLANQQRILSAQLTNVKSTLGQAFLPIAVQAVTFLNQHAVPVFERLATTLKDKLPGAIATATSVLRPFATTISHLFEKGAHGGDPIAAFVNTLNDPTAFDITSSGFPGFMEGLALSFKKFPKAVQDALSGLVVFLGRTVPDAVEDFVNGFKDGAKGIDDSGLDGKLAGLGDRLGKLVKLVEDHKNVFEPIVAAIAGFGAALLVVNKASPVLSIFGGVLNNLGTVLAILVSPIGLVLAGIAALGAAAFLAYKKFTPFKAAVDSVVQTFKAAGFGAAVDEAGTQFGRLWDIVQPKLIEFRDKAVQWLKDHGPEILAALGRALAGAIGFLTTEFLVPFGQWITGTALPWLRDKFGELASAASDWVSEKAVPFLKDKLPAIVDSIIGFLQEYEPEILDKFNVLADAAVNWIETTAIPKLQEKLPGIFAALTEWANENLPQWGEQLALLGLDALGRLTLSIVEHLPDLFLTIPAELAAVGVGIVGGIVAGALADLPTQVGKIKDGILGFFADLPGNISAAAAGMWDGIYDAFKSAINFVIRGWNSLSFTLPEIDTHIPGVGKVGGFTLGVAPIQELAGGGVFTKDFTGLLRLAETPSARPEIVAPQKLLASTFRKELAAVGAGGGGASFGDIHINGYQKDPSTLVDELFAKAGFKFLTGRREL